MRISIVVLASALLTACGSIPIELRAPDPQAAISLPLSEFPGANKLLSGFDRRQSSRRWANGDRVLFGLRLRRGDKVDRWLLGLEVVVDGKITRVVDGEEVDVALFQQRQWSYTAIINGERRQIPIDSAMGLVSVTVHDEHGKQLGKSLVRLPSQLMSRGLFPGIEAALEHHNHGGDFRSFETLAEVRPMAEGLIALIALLDVVQNDDVLEDYFWQVVQKPSVWSVIAALGVRASLNASLEKSVPIDRLPSHMPSHGRAFAMPLMVDVNDTPALVADVIAVESGRPFSLCGGIVAAAARHPSDPSLNFDVQLLAARLGRAKN